MMEFKVGISGQDSGKVKRTLRGKNDVRWVIAKALKNFLKEVASFFHAIFVVFMVGIRGRRGKARTERKPRPTVARIVQ